MRRLGKGDVIGGFAGATADAFTLFERLEVKLEQYPGQLTRAAVELAKDWRTDRYLRRLEAMMIVADKDVSLVLTGTGDVLEPEARRMGIGSGGNYALAAARALVDSAARRRGDRAPRDGDRGRDLRLHQPQCHHRDVEERLSMRVTVYAVSPDDGRRSAAGAALAGDAARRANGGASRRSNSRWSAEISSSRPWTSSSSRVDDRPFAYLQCYDPTAWPENGLGAQPRGTRGIDQFIGEAGHDRAAAMAPHFIRVFVDRLLAAGAPRVLTDPDPANARASEPTKKPAFAATGRWIRPTAARF